MLLRFAVENVLCFKDEAAISLVASNDEKHPTHVYGNKSQKRPRVLRAAAIYGANGHGKTKIVEAAFYLKQMIVRGTTADQKYTPPRFKLVSGHRDSNSKFVIEFRIEANDYEYGIVLNRDYISEEWLYTTDIQNREYKLFERRIDKISTEKYKKQASFGKRFLKHASPLEEYATAEFLKFTAASARVNQPLITELHEKAFAGVDKVFSWFREVLEPITADSAYRKLYERAKTDKPFLDAISAFMRSADVGIDHISFVEKKIDEETLLSFPPTLQKNIMSGLDARASIDLGGSEGPSFRLHKDEEGEIISSTLMSYRLDENDSPVGFMLDEESAGTRRLVDLIPMLAPRETHKAYIIDELDRKLHPILAKKFIETFFLSNHHQLIYTTHNTYLLDLNLLRRDEIWFVQKKPDGSSELYSLSDLKIRPDLDIRKGYLNGRFGAIPFAGNISDLGWANSSSEDC